jgi:hypothetical protein
MAVMEVAADVIAGDRAEPPLSLSFTDRVMTAMKPQEPRMVRIMRLRRVAVVMGPVLSAAAVWMLVASAIRPLGTVRGPGGLAAADLMVGAQRPGPAAMVEGVSPSGPPTTIVDALAEGILTPAVTAWRDTQQSTRDLVALGRLVLGSAGQTLSPPIREASDGPGGAVLETDAVLKNMLTPKSKGESVDEGPDVM